VPKPEFEFFDVRELEATPVAAQPGLTERILSRDPETGDYTRLLYFPPGIETAEVQRHDFWEEVWIVEGAIFDISAQQNFSAGMYACRPPGMPHGPWRSPEGCTTFEVRYFKGPRPEAKAPADEDRP
jgi:hypothetical protein